MTDEDKKSIVSQPPPPTDEIDQEWGDDDQTLVRDVPESVTKSQPAPPSAAVAGTAAAPISVPPKAAEASTPPEMKAAAPVVKDVEDEEDEEDEDEEDEEASPSENEEDEDEDEDEDDEEASAQPAPPLQGAAVASDWLPDWAPYAVLAALVSVSILVGLGLIGGGSAATSDDDQKAAEPAASTAKAPAKPSPHP